MVLRNTPLSKQAQAGTVDVRGLILVLPVENGLPNGRAVLHLDLRSAPAAGPLGGALSRWQRAFALAIASRVAPTIMVAEATFDHGKLEGKATLFAPTSSNPAAPARVVDAEFRDNQLHGVVREYIPGTTQPRRELGFAQGLRHGWQRSFYPSGAVERVSSYYEFATYKRGKKITSTRTKPSAHVTPTTRATTTATSSR